MSLPPFDGKSQGMEINYRCSLSGLLVKSASLINIKCVLYTHRDVWEIKQDSSSIRSPRRRRALYNREKIIIPITYPVAHTASPAAFDKPSLVENP